MDSTATSRSGIGNKVFVGLEDDYGVGFQLQNLLHRWKAGSAPLAVVAQAVFPLSLGLELDSLPQDSKRSCMSEVAQVTCVRTPENYLIG